MKKSIFTFVLILVCGAFVVPANIYALLEDCQKHIEKQLSFKDDPSFPKNAKAKITYCNEYEGVFFVEIKTEGFPANTRYLFTLNGWIGKPGNKELLKYNNHNGEGYVDIDNMSTDKDGKIGHTARFDLPPSDYVIKVFLKQYDMPYKCVMGNDDIRFTIKKPVVPVSFDLPEKIEGFTEMVRGRCSNSKKTIYIFVHPMDSNEWWVQQVPLINKMNGKWHSLCHFGEEAVGAGEYFEVVIILGNSKNEFKKGQKVSVEEMNRLLEKHQYFGPEVTFRVKK